MVFHKEVCLLHSSLTSTPMTNHGVMTHAASSMQMTLVYNGVAVQQSDCSIVEEHHSNALNNLTPYYEENHLRASPSKTQVCTFHLRNHEANRQLNITWTGTPLKNCPHPVYLGVTLDRCLAFKIHVENVKAKVCARNNIISKLTGTTWGASPSTLRSTALALCYSSAEYACPVWERSVHAKKINPALNATCQLVSRCLRPTPADSLYILSGIAPPESSRSAASSNERLRQVSDVRHHMHGNVPAKSRLKSRKSFLNAMNQMKQPT